MGGNVTRDEGFDAYYLRLLKDLYYPDWIEAHLDLADELRDEVRKQNFPAVWAWASTVQTFDLRSQIHRIKLPPSQSRDWMTKCSTPPTGDCSANRFLARNSNCFPDRTSDPHRAP